MSLAETLSPPKEHVTTARGMAEKIFKYSPEEQMEMFSEIKNNLIKRMKIKLEEIEKL